MATTLRKSIEKATAAANKVLGKWAFPAHCGPLSPEWDTNDTLTGSVISNKRVGLDCVDVAGRHAGEACGRVTIKFDRPITEPDAKIISIKDKPMV